MNFTVLLLSCLSISIFKVAYDQTIVRSKLPMSRISCIQSCLCPDYRAFVGVSRPCNFEITTPLLCVQFGLDISTFGLAPQPLKVQALSSLENLDSDLSKPVVAVWPGVVAPQLQCLPTTRQNAIRVGWHSPFVAGNVKLLNYTVGIINIGFFK